MARKKICDSYLKCVLVVRPTEQEISSRVDRIVVSICFYSTEMCVKLPAVRFLNSDQDYCPKSDINFLPVMSGTGIGENQNCKFRAICWISLLSWNNSIVFERLFLSQKKDIQF